MNIMQKMYSLALRIPRVAVNRSAYLEKVFKPYGQTERLVNGELPVDIYGVETVRKVAKKMIRSHVLWSTFLSALSGIPTGFASMFITIPGDLAQYYYHMLAIAQKLHYLYNGEDLKRGKAHFDKESEQTLVVFLGIMLGVNTLKMSIRNWAISGMGVLLKQVPRRAMTRAFLFPAVKYIAASGGTKVSKEAFAKGMEYSIPFIGGIITGLVTFLTLRPMATRLCKVMEKKVSEEGKGEEKKE